MPPNPHRWLVTNPTCATPAGSTPTAPTVSSLLAGGTASNQHGGRRRLRRQRSDLTLQPPRAGGTVFFCGVTPDSGPSNLTVRATATYTVGTRHHATYFHLHGSGQARTWQRRPGRWNRGQASGDGNCPRTARQNADGPRQSHRRGDQPGRQPCKVVHHEPDGGLR